MDPKTIYPLQAYLDVIGTLCYLLDILASPNIEEELEGFSTTQRWIDFVDYTKMINALLKDAVKKYKKTNDFL